MRADDLADLRRKIRVLAGEAEDRRAYAAGLEKRIAELEAERDEWRQRHADLQQMATGAADDLTAARERIADLEKELEEKDERIAQLADGWSIPKEGEGDE